MENWEVEVGFKIHGVDLARPNEDKGLVFLYTPERTIHGHGRNEESSLHPLTQTDPLRVSLSQRHPTDSQTRQSKISIMANNRTLVYDEKDKNLLGIGEGCWENLRDSENGSRLQIRYERNYLTVATKRLIE